MKTACASLLALAATLVASSTASPLESRADGLSCMTLYYGALAVIDPNTLKYVKFVALGADQSLVLDTGSGEYRAQFTFSECNGQRDDTTDDSYGVIQPGTQSSYDAMYGCVTADSSTQSLRIAECASSSDDAVLPQQWFKVYNKPQPGDDQYATATLDAYPYADTTDANGEMAVVVQSSDTGKQLAFDSTHFV